VPVPVLANITEFGKTPLFTVDELRRPACAGAVPAVGLPGHEQGRAGSLSDHAQEGTQKNVVDRMQTREELYEVLGYHDYEKLDKLKDQLFSKEIHMTDKKKVGGKPACAEQSAGETASVPWARKAPA
jgi:2-methylisocitrate lyase-like PEP mutase family enzyme